MSHKEITWNNLQIPVVGSFDVVIIGGGVSGSACGIRCVSEGLSTLIVDKSNLLGGSATRALVCLLLGLLLLCCLLLVYWLAGVVTAMNL